MDLRGHARRSPRGLADLLRLFVTAALLASAGASAAKTRVAALEVTADPPGIADASTLRFLGTEVRRAARDALPNARYQVMTKENQELIFEEMGTDVSKLCEASCEVKVAQIIGADYIFTGTVVKLGSLFVLTVKLHTTRGSGDALGYAQVRATSLEELAATAYENILKMTLEHIPGARKPGTSDGPVVKELSIGGAERFELDGADEEVLVEFKSEPAGAAVFVDGALLCNTTPCRRGVPKRKLEVSMQRERYVPERRAVQMRPGTVVAMRLEPDFAMLQVITDPPGLPVSVNGRKVSMGPKGVALDPGLYEVTVEDDCHVRTGQRVQMDRGVNRKLTFNPPPHMAGLRVRAILDDTREIVANVHVDGRELGSTMKTHKVPACAERLRVVAPDDLEGLVYAGRLSLKPRAKNEVTASFTSTAVARERAEKAAKDQAERDRLERERQERERLAKLERDREKAEQDRLERERLQQQRAELAAAEQREAQAKATAEAKLAADTQRVKQRFIWWSNATLWSSAIIGGGGLVLASFTFASGPAGLVNSLLGVNVPVPTLISTGNDTIDTIAGVFALVGGGTLITLGIVFWITSDFTDAPPLTGWAVEGAADCCGPTCSSCM